VLYPPDLAAFRGASSGSTVYAEFDVLNTVLRPGSKPE